ncbi:MAG TPA: DUF5996 family protein [Micropepsaceae bacterium]|nr:DUF5996 family protein [Micropepsaceae bacterium]
MADDLGWPALSYERDHETFETLHLMTQIVGKVRLALTPWINHSWHVPLYVSARGLSTSLIPHPSAQFDLEFDFIDGQLLLRTSAGRVGTVALIPGSIASFYRRVMEMLQSCSVPTKIFAAPNELPEQVPFSEDTASRNYDGDAARRLWQALLKIDAILKRFRSGFLGKVSPVHFFWGSFDLAVTRFSGRPAPPHPGGMPHLPDAVAREAYSHEVSSAGFWPGAAIKPYAQFYSYAYPEPPGYREARMPKAACYDSDLGEYVLAYDEVRSARDPEELLMDFLQATYVAAAEPGRWDKALECDFGEPRKVRRV